MYELLIGMLKLPKYRCFIDNRLMAGEDCGGYARRLWRLCEEEEKEEKSKSMVGTLRVRQKWPFLALSWSGRAPVGTGGLVYMLGLIGIDFGLFPDTFVFKDLSSKGLGGLFGHISLTLSASSC